MLRGLIASEWEIPVPEGTSQAISVGFIAAISTNQVLGKNMLTGSDWGSCDAIWGQEEILVQMPTTGAEAVWCSAGMSLEKPRRYWGKQREELTRMSLGRTGDLGDNEEDTEAWTFCIGHFEKMFYFGNIQTYTNRVTGSIMNPHVLITRTQQLSTQTNMVSSIPLYIPVL